MLDLDGFRRLDGGEVAFIIGSQRMVAVVFKESAGPAGWIFVEYRLTLTRRIVAADIGVIRSALDVAGNVFWHRARQRSHDDGFHPAANLSVTTDRSGRPHIDDAAFRRLHRNRPENAVVDCALGVE